MVKTHEINLNTTEFNRFANEESSFTIEDYTYPFDFKLCS